MEKKYYHMFANGNDARNFITSEYEFKAAFNRFGLCSYLTGVKVLSCSVEDTHPHALLWGTLQECTEFIRTYESISTHSIARRRKSLDGVNLHCELYEVEDEQYLRNVAAYTIVQATKDGKPVMPYDYLYGTGALYFRSKKTVLPWLVDDSGQVRAPVEFRCLPDIEKRRICGSMSFIPDDWHVVNGFILPVDYIDTERFEAIFRTHNCFRAFLSSGKAKDEPVLAQMATARGVLIDDLEARRLCESACMELFGKHTTRHISPEERLILARQLRKTHKLSFRQLSFLTKVPEEELRKYVR